MKKRLEENASEQLRLRTAVECYGEQKTKQIMGSSSILEERCLAKSFFVSRCSPNVGESLCQRVNENFIFIRNERNQGSLKATVTL